MQFTTTLLAGALATLATACTPDLRPFLITDLSETYVPNEATTWSFTLTRKDDTGTRPMTCYGNLPVDGPQHVVQGTCDDPTLLWSAVGYRPATPDSWSLLLTQKLAHCPPATQPQYFDFATRNLMTDFFCFKQGQLRNGKNVETTRCVVDHEVEASREQYFKNPPS